MPKRENQKLSKHQKEKDIDQNFNSYEKREQSNQKKNPNSIKRIQFYSNAKLMSPMQKDIVQFRDFSTPIQIAEFSQNKKYWHQQQNDQSSPLMQIQLRRNTKNIIQKQNEQSQDGQLDQYEEGHEIQVQTVLDLMGNKICQFNLGYGIYLSEDYDRELSPIVEDKQNQFPEKYQFLNTPLKIRQNDIRSPLQDITPSMTHRKREDPQNTKTKKKNKTSNKTSNNGLGSEMEKWGLLTPRTMAQSRLNKARIQNLNKSMLKIERF